MKTNDAALEKPVGFENDHHDWAVRIKKAREAREQGRMARKDKKPVKSVGLGLYGFRS